MTDDIGKPRFRPRAATEAEIAALNEIEWRHLPDEEAIVEHCLTLANGHRDTALELAPSYVGGRGEARRAALARVAKAIAEAIREQPR